MKLKTKWSRFWKRLEFEIDFFIAKKAVTNADSFLSYPILVDLSFNKEFYYNDYIKNNGTVKSIGMLAVNRIEKKNKRSDYKHRRRQKMPIEHLDALWERYERRQEFIETDQQIREMLAKAKNN